MSVGVVGISGSCNAAMCDCSEHHEVVELLSRSENHLWRMLCSGLGGEGIHAPGMSIPDSIALVLYCRRIVGEGSN